MNSITNFIVRISNNRLSERQAEYVLIGLASLIAILAASFFTGGKEAAKIEAPPGYRVVYPDNGPPKLEKI